MGPLDGVRVIEIASLAPAPFGCMILSDLGADVLRVDRAESCGPGARPRRTRSAGAGRSIGINLKDPAGDRAAAAAGGPADVLVEGFRPGVAERLGFGPEVCAGRNPRLVYGRMTGWGQDGPLAPTAGHDIDYIAVAGRAFAIGRAGRAAGAADQPGGRLRRRRMLLALGVLAALIERERSGRGQVVDAAMVDGSALLTSFALRAAGGGRVAGRRGVNLLDGGAPFYDTYETADGGYVAVGHWRRSSTPSCWPGSGWRARTCPGSTTARAGRCCGPGSPRSSPPAPGTSGPRCSPGPTGAWRRC